MTACGHRSSKSPLMNDFPIDITIDIALLTMVTITAFAVAAVRNLLAATMLAGLYGLLMALVWLNMDSLDVAFTEAAVGAGITTVLFIAALVFTGTEEKPLKRKRWPAMGIVLLVGAALVYGTLDMPRFGDPQAPVHGRVAPEYLKLQVPRQRAGPKPAVNDVGGKIPNVVTVVLASYRGFDTLGEVAVIFTAGIGVLLLLGQSVGRRTGRSQTANEDTGAEA